MTHPSVPAAAPALDRRIVARPTAPSDDPDCPVAHWQALLDARLIGNVPPTPPEIAARRAATDALFRAIAVDRARLARGDRGLAPGQRA